jgi:hypothetical protein
LEKLFSGILGPQRKDTIDTILGKSVDYDPQKKGQINPNSMDYRDDMEEKSQVYDDKGGINPLLTTPGDTASAIEQKRLSGGHSAVLMDPMTKIEDYLVQRQSQQLDQMIAYLSQIASNTSGSPGTKVVGNSPMSLPTPYHVGVKNISEQFSHHDWNLEPGDYQPNSITTEQR